MKGNPPLAFTETPIGATPMMQQFLASAQYRNVKEAWIANQLKSREDEFAEMRSISIMLATWNVNGRKPGESLEKWLLCGDDQPDIYAIGFQELDLSAENFLLNSSPLEALWAEHIGNTLKASKHKYVMLETKRIVGVLLLIFVKEEHLRQIRDVQTGLAAVGIMGMMGNKAGVAIRFNFHETSICIVNAHLNAHMEGVMRRNQDYHDIARRIVFTQNTSVGPTLSTIFDHDYLFWIGDLNYRIGGNDSEVRQKIQEEDWASLREWDQLIIQMRNGAAFEKFGEGQINFAPTYKYDVGTNSYDSSEKNRTPAWTDRILWKGNNLNQISYRRHELMSSDHKPVSSTMELKVKQIIPLKKQKVYQDIVRLLDKAENESRPSAAVDKNALDFGKVRFGVPVTRSIVIENTGKVLAKYKFIPKLDEKAVCRSWLYINPPVALLVPGEKAKISFTVLIDKKTALDFNLNKEKLEDILILHLDGGIDYFVTISGEYLKSCFGSLLQELVRYTGPVRETSPLPEEDEACLSIPKELWRIVDFIFRKGMDVENLFLESGVEQEMEPIRECLDTGESFESYNFSPHSMAETLVRFLDSLGEPVTPYHTFDQLLECSTPNQLRTVLNTLPPVHYNVFYYIIAFLRELLMHTSKNNLSAEQLAVLFGSVMLRRREGNSYQVSHSIGKKRTDLFEVILKPENELFVGQHSGK